MNEELNIPLTKSEALVLFEFLARFNQNADKGMFEDQAEQRVLWSLEASLERQLSELFSSDYSELINKARREIRDND